MSDAETFEEEVARNVDSQGRDSDLRALSLEWILKSAEHGYSYNFRVLGRPIIQYPQDIVAVQELIWEIKPDLIIETGIAHGGSLILSASMLALLDYCDAAQAGEVLDPAHPARRVLGIDIDIREHNRRAIEDHPLAGRIDMIEGSSVDPDVIGQVQRRAAGASKVLVCLDSNHTHEHVLAELEAYAPLVTVGSYCVVFDTIVEDMPAGSFPDRPWDRGDNPKTAVTEYLEGHPEFAIDAARDHKLMISVAPGGFLERLE